MIGLEGENPSLHFFAPLSQNFTNKGTSPLGAADTGQPWWLMTSGTFSPTSPNLLTIINGKLTNTVNAASTNAGYITSNLGALVKTIGCTFTFSPGSGTHGGTLAIPIWKWLLNTVANIPDSCCHMVVTDQTWNYGVFQNNVLTSLASGTFATPLVCDDTTEYSLKVTISGSTATINLPDGTVQTVTDARISSLAGWYPCFEVYQNNSATDPKPKFKTVYADIV